MDSALRTNRRTWTWTVRDPQLPGCAFCGPQPDGKRGAVHHAHAWHRDGALDPVASRTVDPMRVLARIPADFPVTPIPPGVAKGPNIVVDGVCGLGWDDTVSTQWTPAPAGRCPFEHFH